MTILYLELLYLMQEGISFFLFFLLVSIVREILSCLEGVLHISQNTKSLLSPCPAPSASLEERVLLALLHSRVSPSQAMVGRGLHVVGQGFARALPCTHT